MSVYIFHDMRSRQNFMGEPIKQVSEERQQTDSKVVRLEKRTEEHTAEFEQFRNDLFSLKSGLDTMISTVAKYGGKATGNCKGPTNIVNRTVRDTAKFEGRARSSSAPSASIKRHKTDSGSNNDNMGDDVSTVDAVSENGGLHGDPPGTQI